jgi:tetratricopeptide (TPR) repeat protein/2-polyprenyl-3-methyl-5-hydroxy-6-metoxy-1,4-benzoquinol methylase
MNGEIEAPSQQTLTMQQALDIGVEHHNAGRLPEAENIYQQILQAEPNQPVALHLLGVVAYQVGKYDIAVDLITKVLAIKPDYAEAHSNLGLAFQEQGKMDDAVTSYHKALAIKPDYAEAYYNLGNVLKEQGKLDDAVTSYHKTLAIKPDYADAHSNLGNALQEQGKLDETFIHCRRAVTIDPNNSVFWTGLAQSIRTVSFTSIDEDLWLILLNLLERPTVRPANIVQPIISALDHHRDFSEILKFADAKEPNRHIPYQQTAARLSTIPLFLRLIGVTFIGDLKIEQLLTILRRSMLQETMAGNIEEDGLPFASALALQCYTNEYIYPETDEETLSVERLQQQIASHVEQKQDVPPSLIAALGAYRPLHKFSWAQELADHKWCRYIREVIERQISEPFAELSLRSQITCLTSIEDTVSQSVRDQYEENPYPRWINTGLADKGEPIGTALQDLRFDLSDYQSPESPEILIAGCGTGQHALNTASRFKGARVLAVDLSLSSLSYAMRKTNELGISNIQYAQADIMELGNLDRQFDVIESVGVLHHLGDPLAGWKILADLLRLGGMMKIGLYSETARQHIIVGRSLIAEKGYSTAPEGIRQCRHDIMAMAEEGNEAMIKTCMWRDFYSLSTCRDLLFHVQEHRFTLPKIKPALKSLKLQFLGFELSDQSTMRKFKETYPKKNALTSLSQWHKFELKNPDTFRGMYQFWCRKV